MIKTYTHIASKVCTSSSVEGKLPLSWLLSKSLLKVRYSKGLTILFEFSDFLISRILLSLFMSNYMYSQQKTLSGFRITYTCMRLIFELKRFDGIPPVN